MAQGKATAAKSPAAKKAEQKPDEQAAKQAVDEALGKTGVVEVHVNVDATEAIEQLTTLRGLLDEVATSARAARTEIDLMQSKRFGDRS